jgi:ATP-dependent DNA helicase PIF1
MQKRGHGDDDEAECDKRAKTGMVLDVQQQHILDLCLTGQNVFLSGLAGTGKTFLLRHIADTLRAKHGAKRVAVCSPTGISAIIVGGQTIHSMAGCAVPSVVSDFDNCFRRKARWSELAVLILDEASMIEPSYLDWVDATVRRIRQVPHEAMGGIQIICSADFLQLPGVCSGVSLYGKCPVTSNPSPKTIPASVSDFKAYAFQTMFFRDAKFVSAELTKVFRQSEVGMVSALAKIRKGRIDDEVRGFIASCIRELPQDAEIKPTVLYARNKDVDYENETNMNALPGKIEVYLAKDTLCMSRLVRQAGRGRPCSRTASSRARWCLIASSSRWGPR